MKSRTWILFSMLAMIVLLLLVSSFLLKQNNTYKEENRELILQNDSIQSVNIKLSQQRD